MAGLNDKLVLLQNNLKNMEKVLIAYSGGVDSTFLLKVAHDVLGKNAIAVTARSSLFPERELQEAKNFCREYGIEQLIVDSDELDDPEFGKNPVNRCYLCKKRLFGKLIALAAELGIKYLAEGSNLDDLDDFRPGRKALTEFAVHSPLLEAGLSKQEIRELSKEYGLPTWDKPSYACLASRIPYGEVITGEKLNKVELAEQYLLDLGFRQVRVRHHGDVARIEVSPEDCRRIFEQQLANQIYEAFSKIGFPFTALDLRGYRSGSMNISVSEKDI